MDTNKIKEHLNAISELLEPKPWSLGRSIPGFRPLRDGEEFHRQNEWKEEMLPAGFRPLLIGDSDKGEYEESCDGLIWTAGEWTESPLPKVGCGWFRTRRALPEPAPLPEPEKHVPLDPSDWMKDGPWWVRRDEDDNNPVMVIDVQNRCIRFGQEGCYNVRDTLLLQRSNDGINWSKCHKPA